MNKNTNSTPSSDMYKSEIKQLREWGLQTWAALLSDMTAIPLNQLKQPVILHKNKFTFAAFNILMPYPNTPL